MLNERSSDATKKHEQQKSKWITTIKLACTVTTATFFGLGVRAAWKQAKPVDPSDLSKAKIMGGVGFAARTLGIATVISVSGFGLFVLGVSALLDVHTPSQFGSKMKNFFGDRFRISKNDSPNYQTLTELFEAVNTKEKPSEASTSK